MIKDSLAIGIQTILAGFLILASIVFVLNLNPGLVLLTSVDNNKQVLGAKSAISKVEVFNNLNSFFVDNITTTTDDSSVRVNLSIKPIKEGNYSMGSIKVVSASPFSITVRQIEDFDQLSLKLLYNGKEIITTPKLNMVNMEAGTYTFEIDISASTNILATSTFVIYIVAK